MAVAGAVVGEDPLLGGRLDVLEARADTAVLVADVLGLGERDGALEDVERGPGVAARERDEVRRRRRRSGRRRRPVRARRRARAPRPSSARRTTAPTSSSVSGSSRQTRIRDRSAELTSKYGFSVVAPMSVTVPSSTCGRSASCWALLKRWISSRNRIVRVPCRVSRSCASAIVAADLGDARHDRRQRREMGADLRREKAGEARLAGARRAPQQQRRQVAAGDAPPERAALADEVLLADELVEGPRTHPGRQRLPLGRWLEEGFGSGAGRSPRGWHAADGSAGSAAAPSPAKCAIAQRTSRIRMSEPPTMRDPPDVPSDVGVFLGRRDLEAGRARDGFDGREPSASAWSPLRPASPRRRWPPRAPRRGPPPRRSACRVALPGHGGDRLGRGPRRRACAGGVGAVPVGTSCLGLAWPWSVEGLQRGSGPAAGADALGRPVGLPTAEDSTPSADPPTGRPC